MCNRTWVTGTLLNLALLTPSQQANAYPSMKAIQIVKFSSVAVLILVFGLFLHYNLPRTEVVQVTGTDVKRLDRTGSSKDVRTRDVRFLSALTRDGKVKVFRNEDTGWGWPPYFKFSSADITAKVQTFVESPEKPWVRVRYYGWRIKIFSLFPNAISLKVVEKDYKHIPWFNIIFLTLLGIGIFFLVRTARGWMERLQNKSWFPLGSRPAGKSLNDDQP